MATKQTSVSLRESRYVQGGESFVYTDRIGWWERTIILPAADDLIVTVSVRYKNRPDKLAYDLYGKASRMWIILQSNNIVDIVKEFAVGAVLRVPSRTRVDYQLMNKTTGGTPVK